jgi:plasmid stabilization system protein ParE
MEKRFDEIGKNPLLYVAANEIFDGCRRCVCGIHAIYYRQCTGYVEIIRILNKENPSKAIE